MQDHNNGHHQSQDVYSARRHLEDNRVGDLDIARIAIGLDADAVRDRRNVAHARAQRQRRRLAEPREVAERHIVPLALERFSLLSVRNLSVATTRVLITRPSKGKDPVCECACVCRTAEQRRRGRKWRSSRGLDVRTQGSFAVAGPPGSREGCKAVLSDLALEVQVEW